jgi:hypothetical protein
MDFAFRAVSAPAVARRFVPPASKRLAINKAPAFVVKANDCEELPRERLGAPRGKTECLGGFHRSKRADGRRDGKKVDGSTIASCRFSAACAFCAG